MDFGYPIFAILLLMMHGSFGQDDATGASTTEEEMTFQISVAPPFPQKQASIGDNFAFFCTGVISGSTLEPTLEWEFDGTPVTNTDSTKGVFVETKGKDLVLRISNTKDEYGGIYTCKGKVGEKEDSRSVTIIIVKPLEIKSDTEQFGILGQDGNVMCDVTAKPLPTITWLKGNVEIENSDKYIIKSDRLIIKELTLADEMTYTCDIVVRATGNSETLNINYQVVEMPTIQMPPTIEPNNAKVGDEVKIHCSAEGKPTPTYSFKKGGNIIPEDQYDATSGILTIKDLKREDEALYTCIASNLAGSAEQSNTLDVKIPPVIKEIADVPEAVEEGLLTIACEAEGDPAPGVTWKKKGMETTYTEAQDHPKFTTESTSLATDEIKVVKAMLTFDPVKAQDAGEYVCSAINDVGESTKEVRMDVKYKPHFDVPFKQDVFYGWDNHPANLTCQASANELASISWKRTDPTDPTKENEINASEDDDTFKPSEHRQYPDQHLVSRSLKVNIQGDDQSLYGKYICVATNLQGKASKEVTLMEASTPSTPVVSLDNTLSTRVQIAIEKPTSDGGQKVNEYKYTYHVDGDQAGAKDGTVDMSGDSTVFILKDLKPSTAYIVKVQAVNAVGAGSETSLTLNTLKVSKPQKLSLVSDRVGSMATSYKLRWDEPDDGGSPITKFVLRYRQVKVKVAGKVWTMNGEIDKDYTTVEIKGGSAKTYELKSLKRDSYYDIRLQAVNAEGTSDEEFKLVKTVVGNMTEAERQEYEDREKVTNSSVTSGEEDGEKSVGDNSADKSPSKDGSASASLGSGVIIAIIIVIVVLIVVIVLVAVFVTKRRKAAARGDVEGGNTDGKKAAEAEKLIPDNAKPEKEKEGGEGIEEKTENENEFEPDDKPTSPPAPATEAPTPAVAAEGDKPAAEEPATEPTIQITPDTPEKPDNPSA